jgi:hypothetical protein
MSSPSLPELERERQTKEQAATRPGNRFRLITSIAWLVVAIAILFPATLTAGVFYMRQDTCDRLNELRTTIIEYVVGTSIRSRNTAEAVLADPTSTEEQRDVAVRNLEALDLFVDDTRDKFRNNNC